MQNEIIEQGDLLDEQGHIKTAGWSRKLRLNYDRKKIKALPHMIKEWDYYAVLNEAFGIALTIADNGYLGFISATLLDFNIPKEWSKSIIVPFPLGKFNMPSSSDNGNVLFENKNIRMFFSVKSNIRILEVDIPNFSEGKSLKGTLILEGNEDYDTMVIATPFTKQKRFYYNQKINCLKASGQITYDRKIFDFTQNKSFGVLDWGRGVWTYNNTWYWGSASGELEGELFGFNIGYGFGDLTAATENIIFYKGIGHKIKEVIFHIPEDSYIKTWRITSSDGRFEMEFEPVIDRASNTNILVIQSDQHQVFGYFTGKVILDDGSTLGVERFFGFAEKVMNRW